MTKPAKKPALGRGISAIFGNSPEVAINSIKDKNADKIVGNIELSVQILSSILKEMLCKALRPEG